MHISSGKVRINIHRTHACTHIHHTHAHPVTYTYVHTNTCTHVCAHVCTCTHAQRHAHMDTCIHVHIHMCVHTIVHICIHVHNSCAHVHMHADVHTHMPTHMPTRVRICIYTCTHVHTCAHSCTHMCVHTHACTHCSPVLSWDPWTLHTTHGGGTYDPSSLSPQPPLRVLLQRNRTNMIFRNTKKEMYFDGYAHTTVQSEKSHDWPAAGWRTREASGVTQSRS